MPIWNNLRPHLVPVKHVSPAVWESKPDPAFAFEQVEQKFGVLLVSTTPTVNADWPNSSPTPDRSLPVLAEREPPPKAPGHGLAERGLERARQTRLEGTGSGDRNASRPSNKSKSGF